MDALMLRSLQGYIIDTFGTSVWQAVCRRAALPGETFEPMLRYASGTADRVARHAAEVLGRPVETIWEDMGTYLVTNPDNDGVRRLLRFGGMGFVDFLHSLEEMPGRARLALPDLEMPEVELRELGPDRFEIRCRSEPGGMTSVLVGILTAMADDYGVLCLIEPGPLGTIQVKILDCAHSAARRFDLARPDH
ncbi:heme NO-binding domain-containing protein [Tabrizicola caldifontis]|uniref:heme NO-binding domain-containing protein n=1 Tax=Tabrizicola caldifontis TaxID=2528036 RepID=UPI0010821B9D|nr:heme NO-binding domain-containing protein [Rhodobacter sp. YIM 73028]